MNAPPPVGPFATPPQPARDDDPIATIIPYKNKKALIGYYLGVFSLIPCLGLGLGPAALFLGIKGLAFVRDHPEAKGTAHAWVAIVLGGLTSLGNLVGVGLVTFGMLASHPR
jgi:uncharacterized protein YqgC (DUF456 family)